MRAFADGLIDGDPSILDETDPAAPGQALSGEGLRAELARWIHEMGGSGGSANCRGAPAPSSAVRPGIRLRGKPGWFFACRTRGGDRYWRWVRADRTTGPDPDAAILRRIHPRDASGLDEPGDGLEPAWRAAAASIVAEHNELAEADDTGDSIGPLQAWALNEVLEDPEVSLPDGAEDAAEALGVGRGNVVRRSLGRIRRRVTAGEIAKSRAAREIVELVRSEGLRPVPPPERLAPIGEEDVGVVCWMEILPRHRVTRSGRPKQASARDGLRPRESRVGGISITYAQRRPASGVGISNRRDSRRFHRRHRCRPASAGGRSTRLPKWAASLRGNRRDSSSVHRTEARRSGRLPDPVACPRYSGCIHPCGDTRSRCRYRGISMSLHTVGAA